MNQQTIPCPDCGTHIIFDTVLMLQGKRFTCPNCKLSIGIANESHDLVRDAMKKLDDVKGKIKPI